jgi:cation diffusion facilitator family transporter
MAIRTPATASRASPVLRMAAAGIGVAIVVLAIKYAAYLVTGSVALYSDALESIVNILAAIGALLAVKLSEKPADKNHPFGHHKAELFSAIIEGALIIVAALLIFSEAWAAFRSPRALNAPLEGILVSAAATTINGAWSGFLITWGRRWRSPALVADGWHLMSDVITSLGVIAGLGLVAITGWTVLDPLIAIAVALNILRIGYSIVTGSVSGLMDEAAAPEIQAQIRTVIRATGGGALEAHDIRTRHAGRATFIEFHLVVPGHTTVAEAHDICDRIEAELRRQIQGSDVVIHVEPEHKAKRSAKGTVSI